MNKFFFAVEELIRKFSVYLDIDLAVIGLLIFLISGLFVHFSFSALMNRAHSIASASNKRWDDLILTAIERPLHWVLWLLIVAFAAPTFFPTLRLEGLILRILDMGIVLLIAWFLYRLIAGIEHEYLNSVAENASSADAATVRAISKLARILLLTLSGLMILQSMGVSVSGLLAFGGIGGIAVGFAAKDMLANFLGGLSIYLDRPFTIGDWIRSPERDIEGTVEDIGWRITRIRTFDQRPLYVPNSVFGQISVENPSRMHNRRIYEMVGVRYVDSMKLDSIISEVREMLLNHKEIDTSKTLMVNFVNFGPSSLDFFIYTFTKTTEWVKFHAIKQEILFTILEIISKHDAEIAFPTQSLQIEDLKGFTD